MDYCGIGSRFNYFGLTNLVKREHKKDKIISANLVEAAKIATVKENIQIESVDPLIEAVPYIAAVQPAAFYVSLNNGLKQYLASWLSVSAALLDKKTIVSRFDAMGVSNNIELQLEELLDELEWQLYTPFPVAERMQEFYNRAEEMISLLESFRIKHQ
jgi:hypothetical protein